RRPGVVLAEVQKRRASEAGREGPAGPLPRSAVVLRPGELRVAGVPRPQIQDALDADQAASLPGPGPVAGLFAAFGTDGDAAEVIGRPRNPREPEPQLPGHERLEPAAIAVGGVEVVVVGPGDRPVVASPSLIHDGFLRRPVDPADDAARRIRRGT